MEHNYEDPKYYIKQWEAMNEENAEEGCPLTIKIPSEKVVKEWIDRSRGRA